MPIRELPREEWPSQLLELPQPPARLWMRGSLPPPETKLLAVVGSRALTRYGEEACKHLISGLAGYPISIVSGLALGADACAHRAALASGLHTIAIPGSGVDDAAIGPRTNLGLAREILEKGGALLSEHEGAYRAHPHDFPARNRIMVGISHAVLVVEAGEKSGTLITARLAGEYNRDLLCIPHRIGDPHGYGAHLFIRLGAALAAEPLHILEALGITPRDDGAVRDTPPELEGAELLIWNLLDEPRTRDEILRAGSAGAQAGDLLTALVALELRGLAREAFGTWHRL